MTMFSGCKHSQITTNGVNNESILVHDEWINSEIAKWPPVSAQPQLPIHLAPQVGTRY